MRVTVSRWLDRDFFTLTGEADAALAPSEGVANLIQRYDGALKDHGLSLDNAVRGRLWGKDRESWSQGSPARFKYLTDAARAASSSYISPGHFDSRAGVGFDLFAMRPSSAGALKRIHDYEPPTNVMRYMVYDDVVFLSGVTFEQGQLKDQLGNILPRIGQSLADSASGWQQVVRMSCFLHRNESLGDLKAGLAEILGAKLPGQAEYSFVDGFSTPGKLIEIEVTAQR